MLAEYKEWYAANKIGTILQHFPTKVELLDRLVPHAFQGVDVHGHPVYIERAGALDPYVLMSQFADNEILMSHVWGQEHQIRRCEESAAARGLPAGSIERFTTLMDLKGMSMSHRACLKFTKKITEWDEKYYPERMGYVIVVNAPTIFSFFWAIVKPWLNPVTKSKIVFVKGDDYTDLHKLIDPAQLPARYGGTLVDETVDKALEDPDLETLRAEFLDESAWKDRAQEVELASGKKHRVEIPAEAYTSYQWHYKASEAIGFQAGFYPAGLALTTPLTDDAVLTVSNWGKSDAHKLPNQGLYHGDKAGTLVLEWDNDNWGGSKTLTFAAGVSTLAPVPVDAHVISSPITSQDTASAAAVAAAEGVAVEGAKAFDDAAVAAEASA